MHVSSECNFFSGVVPVYCTHYRIFFTCTHYKVYGYFFPETDIIHTGVDIAAKRGTPVIAAAPGTVIWSGYGLYTGSYNEDDPYGMAVTIEHDFGYKDKNLLTVYGHMDRIDVEKGQRVETGTQLGIVGNTGFTTGPHLHYEVIYQGRNLNPVYFYYENLTGEEYDNIVNLAAN